MKKLLTILALALSTLSFSHAQTNLSQGGTGWNTSTKGDLLVGTSSTLRYTRLPIGATGTVLWANNGQPAWIATSSLGFLPFASSTLYVPYIGATGNINLGANNLFTTGLLTSTTSLFTNSTSSILSVTNFFSFLNASSTGGLTVATLFATNGRFTNASTTGGQTIPNLYFTNASSTAGLTALNLYSTGFASLANASTSAGLTVGTNLYTGTLRATGTSTLATTTIGMLGVATTTFSSGSTLERIKVDCGNLTQNCVNVFSTVNDFSQIISGNYGTGINAQGGFTAQNASSTPTTNYIWLGKNGTQFATTTAYNAGKANDGTIMNDGGSLQIVNTATGTANIMNFITGGSSTTTNARLSINGGGQVYIATTSVPTYGFTVATTTQLTETVYAPKLFSNVVGYPSAASTTFNLDTLGNAGIASTTIFTATTIVNPAGTLTNGNMYEFWLKATTTQTVFWGTTFASSTGLSLPSSVASGTTMFLFQYRQDSGKLELLTYQGVFMN